MRFQNHDYFDNGFHVVFISCFVKTEARKIYFLQLGMVKKQINADAAGMFLHFLYNSNNYMTYNLHHLNFLFSTIMQYFFHYFLLLTLSKFHKEWLQSTTFIKLSGRLTATSHYTLYVECLVPKYYGQGWIQTPSGPHATCCFVE